MIKTDPDAAVRTCFELLDQPEIEQALRVGDVFALMVEWFYSQQQMDQAYSLIEKMVAARSSSRRTSIDGRPDLRRDGRRRPARPHARADRCDAEDGGCRRRARWGEAGV